MHDHTQIENPPLGRSSPDGGPALALAERVALHVRVKDVGRIGRRIGIERDDVVRRGFAERIDLHDDLETAQLDPFEHN